MRSKLVCALMAIAAIGLLLMACGRSERKDGAATAKAEMADRAATGEGSQPVEFSLSASDDEGFDLPEREEIRQKRKLTPGMEVYVVGVKNFGVDTNHTQVFVIGINGKVKVETADTETAEVLIVRSARNRGDLQRQKVEISPENNQENLHIYVGDNDVGDDDWRGPRRTVKRRALKAINVHDGADSSPDSLPEIRHRVVLRLPRKAGLEIRRIGGDVMVGEVGGHLTIVGVTGNVRIGLATGPIVIGNIIGPIDITSSPLRANNIKIGGGVNGDVNLRFEGEVNADLNAHEVNGAITPDFPNVEIRESEPVWGALKARIGRGGLSIQLNDINGNVTLSKASNRETSALKVMAK